MAQGLTTLLHRWHAAEGNAASQAELAGALEDAALRMAAAANTALGRAGLQPKQVLLQQVEEQRQAPGATCACMGAAYDFADG